jgi:hypothetical protein
MKVNSNSPTCGNSGPQAWVRISCCRTDRSYFPTFYGVAHLHFTFIFYIFYIEKSNVLKINWLQD